MANNTDFIVKNGLRVLANIVVGSTYSTIVNPIQNGIIVSSNVGIGTSLVTNGTRLSVINGNINLNFNNTQTNYGIVFSDGTFQTTAQAVVAPYLPLSIANGITFTIPTNSQLVQGAQLYIKAGGVLYLSNGGCLIGKTS